MLDLHDWPMDFYVPKICSWECAGNHGNPARHTTQAVSILMWCAIQLHKAALPFRVHSVLDLNLVSSDALPINDKARSMEGKSAH